jgi:hypothetical protein
MPDAPQPSHKITASMPHKEASTQGTKPVAVHGVALWTTARGRESQHNTMQNNTHLQVLAGAMTMVKTGH